MQSQEQDLDFSALTIRRELVNGKFYFYGYKRKDGKLHKYYIGKDLSKLSKTERISVIARKRKISNGDVINQIFQKISRAGLDYTNDQILDSEIDSELKKCFSPDY